MVPGHGLAVHKLLDNVTTSCCNPGYVCTGCPPKENKFLFEEISKMFVPSLNTELETYGD
jgi:hypothetical protein